jgi:hypothetical protein
MPDGDRAAWQGTCATQARPEMRIQPVSSKRLFVTATITAASLCVLALLPAGAALGTTSPRGGSARAIQRLCHRSYDPYRVSSSVLAACGDTITRLNRVRNLPGGGKEYIYGSGATRSVTRMAPPGFKPLTASDTELTEYGYPPRPSGGQALLSWRSMVRKVHFITPPRYLVAEPSAQHGPSAQNVTDTYSFTWAGNEATGNTYRDVYSDYLEPKISSSVCSVTAESQWAGLGGDNTQNFAQGGTAYGESGVGNHQAWYDLSDGSRSVNVFVPIRGLYATPGGQFVVEIDRVSGGYYIFLANTYLGGTGANAFGRTVTFSAFDGSTAEMIVEDPGGGWQQKGPALANFGTFEVEDAEASTDGTTYHGLANWTHNDVIMKSNGEASGTTEASAGSAFNSGDSWYDSQYHCS